MNPFLVIPTLGAPQPGPDRLPNVVALAEHGMQTVIVVTGTAFAPRVHAAVRHMTHVRVITPPRFPINIHRWWNHGIDEAVSVGATTVAVLNDDTAAGSADDLFTLAEAAEGGISYVTPAWAQRETPLTGYAFGIDPFVIRPDQDFEWWWGEHDLFHRAVDRRLTVKPVRVDIRHLRTDAAYPTLTDTTLTAMIDRDRARWTSKWGHQPRM